MAQRETKDGRFRVGRLEGVGWTLFAVAVVGLWGFIGASLYRFITGLFS